MIIVCGFLGLVAGKNHRSMVYIVSFLITSLLELAIVGLVLVFTTTGLIKDYNTPMGFFIDKEVCLAVVDLYLNWMISSLF